MGKAHRILQPSSTITESSDKSINLYVLLDLYSTFSLFFHYLPHYCGMRSSAGKQGFGIQP
jgi:hypothetical protein